MTNKKLYKLFEYYGVDPARITDEEYSKFWALYSKMFYENLFAKINDEDELESVYVDELKDPDMSRSSRLALNFFYNIRRNELEDPNFWSKVGMSDIASYKNESYKMKAKTIKESLLEFENMWDEDGDFGRHIEKRTSSQIIRDLNKELNQQEDECCEDDLEEYGGGSPGPIGGPMAGSQNYSRETNLLVDEVSSLEQEIWNSGNREIIRKWDNYSEELLYGDVNDFDGEEGEQDEKFWDDLDDYELNQAIEYAENLLKK